LNIRSITIQGFRTFKERQTFKFIDITSKTLSYVTGKNKVEENLEGNDVGKSSLFEALCFAFYGMTSTKLRAGDIGNWDSDKKCYVALDFENNGKYYTLLRRWNPNFLEVSVADSNDEMAMADVKKGITQQELEDIIGLGFSGFLYSVFISQFTSKFFDLEPSEKLKIFSDILNLDDWINRSEKAKEEVKLIKNDIDVCTNNRHTLEGKISVLSEKDFKDDIKDWDKNQKVKIKEIDTGVILLKKEITILNKSVSELKIEEKELKEELKLETIGYNKISDEFDKIKECVENFSRKIRDGEKDLSLLQKSIDKFEDVKDTCPYCFQDVSPTHLRDELRKLDKEANVIETKMKADQINKKNAFKKMNDLNLKLDKRDKVLNDLEDDIKSVVFELGDAVVKVSTKNARIRDFVKSKDTINSEDNPFVKLKEENDKRLSKVKDDLKSLEKEFSELERKSKLYEFWVKGFKDVRLFVVSQALQEFEICINNNLQKLGLSEWEVKLDIEKETRGGKSIKRGFEVKVVSPYNNKSVPFKCWGGGVSQRLRIAGTMGLIDLIRSRTGSDWNIEIWDEPTQWLSSNGVDQLLELLMERAILSEKKLFLIDHRKLNSFGGFYNIINIEKDIDGSKISIETG
tara:strand:- start:7126 stop:9018 length:1893 start_codon:yes stop_codon:yes gene_type:complete